MPDRSLSKMVQCIEAVSLWVGKISSWMILVMIGALAIEVVLRYFFASPTDWAYELTTMVYGSYCVLVGAYTHLRKGHIRMDAIYIRFSRRTQLKMDLITGWMAVGFLALFLWVAWKFAIMSWQVREYSSATTWEAPLYPFKFCIVAGVLLLLLQQIATMIKDYLEIQNRYLPTEVNRGGPKP